MAKKSIVDSVPPKTSTSAVVILRQNLRHVDKVLNKENRTKLFWSSTSDFAVLSAARLKTGKSGE